jgi:hypothetical protein
MSTDGRGAHSFLRPFGAVITAICALPYCDLRLEGELTFFPCRRRASDLPRIHALNDNSLRRSSSAAVQSFMDDLLCPLGSVIGLAPSSPSVRALDEAGDRLPYSTSPTLPFLSGRPRRPKWDLSKGDQARKDWTAIPLKPASFAPSPLSSVSCWKNTRRGLKCTVLLTNCEAAQSTWKSMPFWYCKASFMPP